MIGSASIDLSLENIWKSWWAYKKGKKSSHGFYAFQYELEDNLLQLWRDLNDGSYRHGGYHRFTVSDNKTREISVASIRDRVVHRLLYDYLVPLFDQTFIYDAWSCRMGKGLIGAIERTQGFSKRFSKAYVWRADVQKFFDNVNHEVLLKLLQRRAKSLTAILLISEVIRSYSTRPGVGVPIGNLTSQIFANIYLNELDRYVKHFLKPLAYLRYGDDFILFADSKDQLISFREAVKAFLEVTLKLQLHPKNDLIVKVRHGLKFLGCWIYPKGRKLMDRNWKRVVDRLNLRNVASYHGLVFQHSKMRKIKEFVWRIVQKLGSLD